MAPRKLDSQVVEAEVAALGDLDLTAIRERWRALFGRPPPKTLRHAFLVKACAYAIRIKAFGGLSSATRRRLRSIADAAREGKPTPAAPVPTKAGTRLIRAWGGDTHVVSVLPDGRFEYDGKTYRSLSAIAGVITGTNWNGKTFFGVKRPAKATDKEASTTGRVSAARAATSSRSARGRHTTMPGGRALRDERNGSVAVRESGVATACTEALNTDTQLEMFGRG
jgi:hypothetical protein